MVILTASDVLATGLSRTDFYAASAAVIPVLLLTASIQATYFDRLDEAVGKLLRRLHLPDSKAPAVTRWLAFLLFVAAAVAELLALRGLWYNHELGGVVRVRHDRDPSRSESPRRLRRDFRQIRLREGGEGR
jgi:hypothetical protein